jgi:hypothetical protein
MSSLRVALIGLFRGIIVCCDERPRVPVTTYDAIAYDAMRFVRIKSLSKGTLRYMCDKLIL